MIARKLNERITFFERKSKKDDNGDSYQIDEDLFSCWAEVAKSTTKEFRGRSNDKIEDLKKRRNKKTLYLRFRTDVDSGMLVKWRSHEYKVIDLEEDWQSKDMLMVTVEVVE
ncbi:phage head closure protein [Enterococcus gallinarum]|uniref:phage head closure protein n=1 Tax=Enterococcus gallinarum TaxID=1353 RepID=UPI003BE7E0EF